MHDALVVYLDQCVVSRFIERPVDPRWREVQDLLRRGVETNRVVADVIVTDGSAASAIRDVGLDRSFGTKVFSTRDSERAALVELLNGVTA